MAEATGGITIVGRTAELAAVAEVVDASVTASRGASAVVLEGDPGIGKTTLWRWAVDRARANGLPVLLSRPAESERVLAYSALGDLLEPVLDGPHGRMPAAQRLALDTALAVLEPSGAPVDRLAVSRAALSALRSLERTGPVALAIDDVQWLDAASAAALEFCLRRLDEGRLRVLMTRRADGDAAAPFGLDRLLVPGAFTSLRLGPLSIGDLDELVRMDLGVQLLRPRLAELHRISGGNPYFALEMARARAQHGGAADEAWKVPGSLGALLRDRLGGLSPDARRAVLLAAASAHPTRRILERAGADTVAVDEAIRGGVLQADGPRLRFSHPMLGSVAYDTADSPDQRDAHLRLAEVAIDPEERALHLASVTDEPDASVVATLEHAAERAAARGAPESAAQLGEHALRLSLPDDPGLVVRMLRVAEHHLAAGDTDRARQRLEQAERQTGPGPTRGNILCRLGQVATVAADVPASNALFQRALDEAAGDAAVEAVALHGLAFNAPLGGDVAGGLSRARAAFERAEALGDPGILGLTLGRLVVSAFLAGEGLDRAGMERAVSLEERISGAPVEWLPSYGLATISMFADDFSTARRLYAALHERALALDDGRVLPSLLFQMAQLECWAGDWPLASRHAADAVERARQSAQKQVLGQALYSRALVDAHLGRVDPARSASGDALRIAEEVQAPAIMTLTVPVLGFLELSLGDAAAAHERLAPLAQMIAAIGAPDPGIVRFLPDEIESLILLGRLADAEAMLVTLEERAGRLDRISARAAAARCRALLHAAAGDLPAADGALAEALAQHERLAQPFELGRTLLAKGSIDRRSRRRSEARAALTRAADLFRTLGAVLWEDKANAELSRISGRAPGAFGLTDTEARVARLVAEGLSNREVAAALFVTDRTVEGHLSRIYAKLQVRSRTGLVRYLERGEPSEQR